MPTELLEKYKQHIINLLVVFVFVFIAVQVYKDQAQKINAFTKQKQDQETKNDLLDQIKQQEGRSQDIVTLINNKDVAMTMSVLSGLAKQAGVNITSLRPEAQQGFQFYTKYIYQLSVEAPSYHAVARFISLLENHQNIYIVEQTTWHPEMDQAEGTLLKVIGTLRVSTVLAQSQPSGK